MAKSCERFVAINADDFGLTNGINRGIIEAHERGVVSSASVMVRYPAASEAAAYARMHPEFGLGLHFEAGEWRCEQGEWRLAYQVVDAKDAAAVRAELERQLDLFRQLMEGEPTHLDSHQHVHQSEPARAILLAEAERLNVPLRSCDPAIKYYGGFYGQTAEGEPFPAGIALSHLVEVIEKLEPGWTELGCHPGYADGLDSVYLSEREEELRVLCDNGVRLALERNEVQLCSFREFQKSPGAQRADF